MFCPPQAMKMARWKVPNSPALLRRTNSRLGTQSYFWCQEAPSQSELCKRSGSLGGEAQ